MTHRVLGQKVPWNMPRCVHTLGALMTTWHIEKFVANTDHERRAGSLLLLKKEAKKTVSAAADLHVLSSSSETTI